MRAFSLYAQLLFVMLASMTVRASPNPARVLSKNAESVHLYKKTPAEVGDRRAP
ncbi:hypothetical protein EST38_g4263 [Candolleomyces aberdarensis]|uniref:Uncharacterized protein n=1 Tax=Candolleomyces aberdarensis TaxID=2316362 RepID=A0A4Q2DMZ8_9AGAR|nr:hypothetical protein EST38_g4263 [Candolleomyces aberdarensis]